MARPQGAAFCVHWTTPLPVLQGHASCSTQETNHRACFTALLQQSKDEDPEDDTSQRLCRLRTELGASRQGNAQASWEAPGRGSPGFTLLRRGHLLLLSLLAGICWQCFSKAISCS